MEHTSSNPTINPRAQQRLLGQYTSFVLDTGRTLEEREQEFYDICALPFVSRMAIDSDTGVLVAQTTPMVIHITARLPLQLGCFAIALRRKPPEVQFFPADDRRSKQVVGHMSHAHPHVNNNGSLCISGGKHELYSLISRGEIREALLFCRDILQTIDWAPYGGLQMWTDFARSQGVGER